MLNAIYILNYLTVSCAEEIYTLGQDDFVVVFLFIMKLVVLSLAAMLLLTRLEVREFDVYRAMVRHAQV